MVKGPAAVTTLSGCPPWYIVEWWYSSSLAGAVPGSGGATPSMIVRATITRPLEFVPSTSTIWPGKSENAGTFCSSNLTLRPPESRRDPSSITDARLIRPSADSQQILPHTHTLSCDGTPTGCKSSGEMAAFSHMATCMRIKCRSTARDRSSSVVNMNRYRCATFSKSSSLASSVHRIPNGLRSDGSYAPRMPNASFIDATDTPEFVRVLYVFTSLGVAPSTPPCDDDEEDEEEEDEEDDDEDDVAKTAGDCDVVGVGSSPCRYGILATLFSSSGVAKDTAARLFCVTNAGEGVSKARLGNGGLAAVAPDGALRFDCAFSRFTSCSSFPNNSKLNVSMPLFIKNASIFPKRRSGVRSYRLHNAAHFSTTTPVMFSFMFAVAETASWNAAVVTDIAAEGEGYTEVDMVYLLFLFASS